MKFTLSWLKTYLETDASADALAEKLTAIGLEVEALDKREVFQPFVLAKVAEAAPHPNADKLQILRVDTGGKELLQVVCGAPNARKGLIGVFAPPGAYVPGLDTVLSVGKIRDAESFGMMCSERELLLSDEHNGIIAIDEAEFKAKGGKIGMGFAAYRGLDDPVFEIGLTPNRADCASVYGIARDLSAAGLGRLKSAPAPALPKAAKGLPAPKIIIEDKETCLGYAALRAENIENRAAPAWLQARLAAIGCAVKNAAVDIGNYIGFDIGRPLHMFDADKVKGALHIRRARDGEVFAALNGKTYALNGSFCVIADDSGVISLPGIMGGEATACGSETKNVLIESAEWNKAAIARMGRALGISSDARYRFERGVDAAQALPALARAAQLLAECAGTAKTRFSAAGGHLPKLPRAKVIAFPPREIKRLSGLDVAEKTAEATLAALGFKVEREKAKTAPQAAKAAALWQVAVPSWRGDVEGKADLVEEVLRICGADKITPQALPRLETADGKILTPLQNRSRLVRRVLASRAMAEAITYSFISSAAAALFGGGAAALKLQNPIAADMSDMRVSLLPGLLAAAARNAARGRADIALFELGDVYLSAEPAGQKRMAAGLRAGSAGLCGAGRLWSGNAPAADCFAAKADALAALEAAGIAADKTQTEAAAPSYFHPGRSGVIKLGPKITLGAFGELHPQIAEFFGLRGAVCGFELFLEAIPAPRKKAAKTKPALELSPFQPVKRDFSFIIAENIGAAAVLRAARGADKKHIAEAQIFDVFTGGGIAAGEKALGVEIVIQPETRSLRDEELESISQKVIDAVLKATKGRLRL